MKFTAEEMVIICSFHCGTKRETIKFIQNHIVDTGLNKEETVVSLLEKLSSVNEDEPIELAFDKE